MDGYRRDGTTFKVNLALRRLPRFTCLPGQSRPVRQHHAPVAGRARGDGGDARGVRRRQGGRAAAISRPSSGTCTPPSIPRCATRDGHHNSALFVQWVPYELSGSTWEAEEERYVRHLLGICDRFAPGTSALVADTFALTPKKIEQHFGITRGHIHHVDNSFGFADRLPYVTPVAGALLVQRRLPPCRLGDRRGRPQCCRARASRSRGAVLVGFPRFALPIITQATHIPAHAPRARRDPVTRWKETSRSTALAFVAGGQIGEANARYVALDAAVGPWRWMQGPHAKVQYESLSELVRGEAATLAPAPYLSRFQRGSQVLEIRLERLDGGEALALIHDVTSDLRRQREMQQQREALLHEERMHAMGVLASGVAHDLNHALNVIALRVATLRADPHFSSARRSLDVLTRVVGDAARIIARLQDLARRRRDRPTDPLDLAAVLTGAVEMARTEYDAAHVRIEADVPPLPLVRGSAAELAHVLGSLLLHAREQISAGGLVSVHAREDRGRVVVTIRDSGEGMREEDLARLFDPFSGVAGESALGLSVAWGVMSRLGGSLQAHTRRGEGTTFTLVFPLAAPPRLEPPRAAARERRRGRILIVDDEQDNLDVLREIPRAGGPGSARGAPGAGGAGALRLRRALPPRPLRRGHAGDERLAGGAGDPADRSRHAGVDADRLGQRDWRVRSAAQARARGAGKTARPRSAPLRARQRARADGAGERGSRALIRCPQWPGFTFRHQRESPLSECEPLVRFRGVCAASGIAAARIDFVRLMGVHVRATEGALMPARRGLGFVLAAVTFLLAAAAQARITKIQITTTESPTFGGYSLAGRRPVREDRRHRLRRGRPARPEERRHRRHRARAAQRARQRRVLVRLLHPEADRSRKGAHKVMYEPPNRGRKTWTRSAAHAGGNDPGLDHRPGGAGATRS